MSALAELSRAGEDHRRWEILGHTVLGLMPKGIVIVNSVDEEARTVRVEGVQGIPKAVAPAVERALGFHPGSRAYPLTETFRRRYREEGLFRFDGGLCELAAGFVPAAAVRRIERLLHLTGLYTAGLLHRGVLLATVHIALQGAEELSDRRPFEDFLAAAGPALVRSHLEERATRTARDLKREIDYNRLLLNTSTTQVWFLQDEETYGVVNQAHADFLGMSIEEASFRPLDELFSPTESEICRQGNLQVFRTGSTFHNEEWVADSTGEPHLLTITKTPHLDEAGAVAGVVCTAEDITEERRTLEALREKSNELERFFTVALDLLVITDTKGTFLRLNRAWEDTLGHSVSALEGRSFLEFVHPDDTAATREAMGQLAGGTEIIDFVNRYRASDGSYRYIEWRSHPHGELIYAAARDVTDRIEREEAALAASRAKSNFLANMSHELRTPLNGIVGFADLLRDSELPEPYGSYVESVHASAETLMTLINDILDFSKIEAGKLQLDISTIDLHELLRRALETVRFSAENKGLELIRSVSPDVPRFLQTDSFRLTQVLINLLGNAVKFTDYGFVQLIAKVIEEDDDYATLYLAVRDTGIGIEPRHQRLIFESFTQADPSTTRKFGGTGLGLAISSRILAMLGTSLDLESYPGQGSTFGFTIRLGTASPPVADEATGEGPTTRADVPVDAETVRGRGQPQHTRTRPLRVLLAEDERINLLVTRNLIERAYPGSHVVVAADGAEAVRAFSKEPFDLILLDVQMPHLDGYEAARQIREDEAGHGRVPIVALTAGVVDGERERCIEAGMDDYVSKPVTLETFQRVTARWTSDL